MSLPRVTIFTDGSCRNGYAGAGWCAIIRYEQPTGVIERVVTGHTPGEFTNIRAEMSAVIAGLEALKRQCHVELTTDLQMIEHGINGWLDKWVRQGWRNTEGKRIQNEDLWREIYRLKKIHRIMAYWTRGHVGHVHNERADEYAGLARLGTLTNYVQRLEGERL